MKTQNHLFKNVTDKRVNLFTKNLIEYYQKTKATTLTKILKNLNGESESIQTSEDLSPNNMVFFKYAPITSVDVDGSFSRYKNLLTDKRRSMVFENIAKMIVLQCNPHLGK